VKSLERSVEFYTKLLGMEDLGRSTIEATKGERASLESSDGRFVLELNYYPRNSPFYTKYVVGEGWTISLSGCLTSTRPSPKPRSWAIQSPRTSEERQAAGPT
jgi:catechol 2,3-dioxygenase-like lactoylglutathione lyase family enzyme